MTSKSKKAAKQPKVPVESGKDDVPAKATPDATPDTGSVKEAAGKKDAPAGATPEQEKDATTTTATSMPGRDSRLPPVGTKLTRIFHGKEIVVEVLEDGFLFNGTHFRSLSGVAKTLTGTSTNGFVYFGLSSGSGRSRGTRLATKIRRIESLIGKLKVALDDGQTALAEAEAEHEALTAQVGNQPEA